MDKEFLHISYIVGPNFYKKKNIYIKWVKTSWTYSMELL